NGFAVRVERDDEDARQHASARGREPHGLDVLADPAGRVQDEPFDAIGEQEARDAGPEIERDGERHEALLFAERGHAEVSPDVFYVVGPRWIEPKADAVTVRGLLEVHGVRREKRRVALHELDASAAAVAAH